MATISENLQIIKDSTDAIKQAIMDKGGEISGDITTWADAIGGISGGEGNLRILSIESEGILVTRVFTIGMTWEEWINGIYNTTDGTIGSIVLMGDYVYHASGALFNPTGGNVHKADIISDIVVYSAGIGHSGGGAGA